MSIILFKQKINQFKKILIFSFNIDKKAFISKAFSKLIQIPFPILQAYIAKLIMDELSLGLKTGEADSLIIYKYIIFEFLLVFIKLIVNSWQKNSDFIYKELMNILYEKKVFEKLQKIDLSYIEKPEVQNKIYEVTHRSYNIEQLLDTFFNLIQGISILISFLGILLAINLWIGLLLIIITFITFISNHSYSKKKILNFKLSRSVRRLKNHFHWILTNPNYIKENKILDIESRLLENYQNCSKDLFNKELAINKIQDRNKVVLNFVSSFFYYLSYGWVIYLTLNQIISLGDLTMFVLLFKQTESGLNNIFGSIINFSDENSKIDDFYNFLELPEINSNSLTLSSFKKIITNPIIEFKDVSFNYPNGCSVLKNINFSINPGSKIALVGENGAGKSTIIKLICGLYKPTSGQIFIGGFNLDSFSRSQIKEIIGVVFQDFVQFPFSFKENITISEKNYTEIDYLNSLESSGANKVRNNLSLGDNQLLNKHLFETGVDLSGGEWQKVALSRAFIQKGPVIILDEPTSSIDANQEYEIFKKFQELTKDKTSILVSHKFSTVRTADRILFLENGQIVEDGSHNQLLAINGRYSHMFHLQANGYR